jgi:multidrug efflux system membrane fusion protein
MPVPVRTARARTGALDVTLDVLGSVTARNAVVVRVRVDGLLQRVRFAEGADVHEHDVLAEIDPRPYQAALKQAEGQLARDQALLDSAKVDLNRYQQLLAQDSIAKQQVDDQVALVHQYEGVVLADHGAVDTARLNLSWTQVTAPISGRVGLRQIDVGNVVHATDANGLVVLNQTQPINVTFAVSADKAPSLVTKLRRHESIAVDAYDRDGKTLLAHGRLESADNVVDAATGTVKLKAFYDNKDNALLPNQFVNARVTLDHIDDQILVPSTAVQHGTPGAYVYLVGPDNTVSVRVVSVGAQNGDLMAITTGLAANDTVVVDGTDKLHDGSRVEPARDAPSANERHGGSGRGQWGHAATAAGRSPDGASPGGEPTPDRPAGRRWGGAGQDHAGPPDEATREAWRKRREAEKARAASQP